MRKEGGEQGAVASAIRRLSRQVLQGFRAASETASSPVVLDMEVDGIRCVLTRPASGKERVSLSPRELEIARLVAKGHPNKVIASILEISSWTVGTYLRRIFAKMGVVSRAAMVARLAEAGTLAAVPIASSITRVLRSRQLP